MKNIPIYIYRYNAKFFLLFVKGSYIYILFHFLWNLLLLVIFVICCIYLSNSLVKYNMCVLRTQAFMVCHRYIHIFPGVATAFRREDIALEVQLSFFILPFWIGVKVKVVKVKWQTVSHIFINLYPKVYINTLQIILVKFNNTFYNFSYIPL